MPAKYHIWTIGCQMNEADSRYLASQLEDLGFSRAESDRDADLHVINTCVVRQQAEDKIYERLRNLKGIKRQNPGATIAVMGCLVGHEENPALRERLPFVDVFMPPSDTRPLISYLRRRDGTGAGLADERLPATSEHLAWEEILAAGKAFLPKSERGKAVAAFVPVVLGCSYSCTFCVIPHRRGRERSRPKEEILAEIRSLADQGVREVTLLGQTVDRYGLDLDPPTDLSALLREVAEVDGLWRIRFLTSHPNWLTDELIDTVASVPKVCPHIEVPFQAGNDEVLARMKRGYTIDQYRRLIERIRGRIPEAAIHTDIIVGFPGETEEQFMDSYNLLAELNLDMARIAKYSERTDTWAAKHLPDDVPSEEKERRRVMLEDLLSELLTRKHECLRAKTVEVLVEERSRGRRWGGRTPQSKRVFFEDDRDLRGQLVNVTIDWPGPFTLVGRAAD